MLRFEEPCTANRWDCPLFKVEIEIGNSLQRIYDSNFEQYACFLELNEKKLPLEHMYLWLYEVSSTTLLSILFLTVLVRFLGLYYMVLYIKLPLLYCFAFKICILYRVATCVQMKALKLRHLCRRTIYMLLII